MSEHTTAQPQRRTQPTFVPAPSRVLQRKCACGGTPGPDGECAACRQKRLQRRAIGAAEPAAAPSAVGGTRSTPDQPLGLAADALARLGHSFGRVRVAAAMPEEEQEAALPTGQGQRVTPVIQRQADTQSEAEQEEETVIPLGPGELMDQASAGGESLSAADQTSLGSFFNAELGGVRVHNNSQADSLCRQLHARAFTYGTHIFFRSGEYQPVSTGGRLLLAHEVSHVMQQQSGRAAAADEPTLETEADNHARAALHHQRLDDRGGLETTAPALGPVRKKRFQCWRYATAADASPLPGSYVVVPAAHQRRVDQAMGIIERIVNDRANFRACHNFFQTNCPGGTATTLSDQFRDAIVWRRLAPPATMLASSISGTHHIAYANAFPVGRWAIAASFIHELIHTCGQASHDIGDDAKAACGRLPNI